MITRLTGQHAHVWQMVFFLVITFHMACTFVMPVDVKYGALNHL